MDIQIILIFILALLTANLLFVGVYVVLVLKELRETIRKANSVLDDVQSVSSLVTNPISSIAGVVSAVAEGYKTVKSISSLRDSED